LKADPRGVRNFRRAEEPRRAGPAERAAGLTSWLIACGAALVIGCGTTAALTSEDQAMADTASQSSSEPGTRSAGSCDSLPSVPIIARAELTEPDRELLVVGKLVGEGESDRRFEVIDAQLLLTSTTDACIIAAVPIGELTRFVSEAGKPKTPDILELAIQPLGEMEGFYEAVAFERTSLPDGTTVLLVHLMRDVRFGLTERYAVPVTIQGDRLTAGDRVQTGRDAMEPPVYYGIFEVSNTRRDITPRLVLERNGMGRFPKRVEFALDAKGALQATEEPVEDPSPPVDAEQRDGRDTAHALQVCGPQGAEQALTSETCPDGSNRGFERKGIAGAAEDGHIVDRYQVHCGSSEKQKETVYVDIYHCEDKSASGD